jgi:hypothetical protein
LLRISDFESGLRPGLTAKLEQAGRALAEAKTRRQAKAIRDMAQAAADLLRQPPPHFVREKDLVQQAVADAMERKLWAERKLGEILQKQDHCSRERVLLRPQETPPRALLPPAGNKQQRIGQAAYLTGPARK